MQPKQSLMCLWNCDYMIDSVSIYAALSLNISCYLRSVLYEIILLKKVCYVFLLQNCRCIRS